MIEKNLVEQVVNDKIDGTGYFLVDIQISAQNDIVVEIDNIEGVDLDFCAKINRAIEDVLNRDKEDFSIEVGSTGITSPFKVLKQYEKNVGNEVEVLTKDGRKLTGILVSVEENQFIIEVEEKEKLKGAKRKTLVKKDYTFSYEEIKYTKYNIRFK